jgi:hypothetical protein
MQVLGTGHEAAHCGVLKMPLHSVHLPGLITNTAPFADMAWFGHSNSQLPQPVQLAATIL